MEDKLYKYYNSIYSQVEMSKYKNNFIDNNIPFSTQINILNACYQRCVGCRKPDWPNIKLKDYIVYDVLNWTKYGRDGHSVVFSGGDPPAHENFLDFLEYAHDIGLGTGTLSACLWGKNFDVEKFMKNSTWISISIDGATEEIYTKCRGVNTLEKVKDNIKLLQEIKIQYNLDTRIRCNSTISNINVHQMKDIFQLCNELGIESFFFPIHTWNDLKVQNIDRDQVKIYVDEALKIHQNSKSSVKTNIHVFMKMMDREQPKSCIISWTHCFVDANGDVTICCRSVGGGNGDNGVYSEDKSLVYGNLYEDSMEKIWNSKRALEIRNKTYNAEYSFCKDCDRYNSVNKNYYNWIDSRNENKELIFL